MSNHQKGYIIKKKNMNFQSVESLQSIVNVVNEAAAAVNDKKRTIRESAIPEVLAGALGAGIGGVGVGVASHLKNKQLRQEKERLYKEALSKHDAIIKALKEEADADKERMDYLQSLNILLQRAITDLQKDLGIAS